MKSTMGVTACWASAAVNEAQGIFAMTARQHHGDDGVPDELEDRIEHRLGADEALLVARYERV